jgi:hypothetical protein
LAGFEVTGDKEAKAQPAAIMKRPAGAVRRGYFLQRVRFLPQGMRRDRFLTSQS